MPANTIDSVHLVGSIGLDSVEDVFITCGTLLGRRLKRLPDGEVGGRRQWIGWQIPLLRSVPFLTAGPPRPGNPTPLHLTEGAKPEDVHFGELGYAREARISYLDFLEAREKGYIAPGVRFMVALPTPYAVIAHAVDNDSSAAVYAGYSAAMLREVERILDAIPHDDLAMQWDVCVEMVEWDGSSDYFKWKLPGDAKTETSKELSRIADAIPADVEMGIHLCYGDLNDKHFFNPKDATAMVDLANTLAKAVERRIDYIHMPVPIDRTDDAFFKPFDHLALDPKTEIYLGVVHLTDGVEGLNRRVEAARKHLPRFGISTECGMARARSVATVRDILNLHAAASSEPPR